jgi:uncharacterized protein (DUF2147 family)
MRFIKAALVGAGLVVFSASLGLAQSADDVLGTWQNPDNGSHIRIAKCGSGVCATVIKVKDPSRTDEHNPDPKLRDRKVQGLTIMNGAKKTGDKTWAGKLYNTQDGKTYNGTITVVSKDSIKLEGCVLGGLICQGPTWTRID